MATSPTKAYVLPIDGRDADIETLRKLIEAAGCEIVCPEDPRGNFAQCVELADVVVILICPETLQPGVIDEVVALAKRLGKRVVGVWASEAEPDRLPSMIHRHGDATVGLNPEKIEAAVCGGKAIWDCPGGGPRPKPPTPRHKGH